MCGPAGAGKSTIARQLASAGMVPLSFDEAAWHMSRRPCLWLRRLSARSKQPFRPL
ncbi:hypothetical protein [Arthrobacter sp. ZGTC412]|uniref:hypothetical protein n=1 Tax=Arthrobacter sp. ZGTC412 TaxID=2058900 RepID=UPI0035A14647